MRDPTSRPRPLDEVGSAVDVDTRGGEGEQERGTIPAGLTASSAHEVPLDPGAARYYREKGYIE